MFHYRCFLVWMLVGITSPVPAARGTLRTVEDNRGFLGSFGVNTGPAPANCAGYRGSLGISTGNCPKSRFWALTLICMGNEVPSDKRALSPVEALARENPTQLMTQLRAVWPQVQDALKAGHTLRLIHKRLNLAGVPISYKLLSSYRRRIERRKKGPAPSVSTNMPLPAGSPDCTPPAFDPLTNFRAQEQKRKDWKYPSGPPDESKLI